MEWLDGIPKMLSHQGILRLHDYLSPFVAQKYIRLFYRIV